jgi:PAS domain S-box-containing protein
MRDEINLLNRSPDEVLEIYRSAMEAAGVGFSIADATKPDFPLVYVNATFEQLTGYTTDEVLGRSCRFLQGDDRDQPGVHAMRQALRDGAACTVSLRNYRKDGSLFWNQISLTPVRAPSGSLTHFVGIQTDVTALKRAQEEAIKAEALRVELLKEREITTLRENIVSMVSHDLRNPLTAIMVSLELMEMYDERLTREKRLEYIQRARRQGDHMRALLDDILTYSRGRAGKLEFHPQTVNLEAFCRRLLDEARAGDAGAHPVNFCYVGEVNVKVDEKLLYHIIINLLSNAMKYSAPGSEVGFHIQSEPSQVIFTIRDQGMGIPESDQKRLFEPFHRAGNAREISGTGLGLAIVKNSVDGHGGTIECRSVEGAGTTFTARLPVK